MTAATHTAGQWIVLPAEASKPYLRIRGTVLGGRYKIANVLAVSYDGAHQREEDETVANARLIAAAPDLLVALKTIIAYWDSGNFCRNAVLRHAMCAAVAKAEGSAP